MICPHYSFTGQEGLGPPNCLQRSDENSGKSKAEPAWASCYEVSQSLTVSEASKQGSTLRKESVVPMSIQGATLAHLLPAPGPLLMLFLLLELPFPWSPFNYLDLIFPVAANMPLLLGSPPCLK